MEYKLTDDELRARIESHQTYIVCRCYQCLAWQELIDARATIAAQKAELEQLHLVTDGLGLDYDLLSDCDCEGDEDDLGISPANHASTCWRAIAVANARGRAPVQGFDAEAVLGEGAAS